MKKTYSKIDIAKLQLDQAIWLYFYEKDVVSIHTLISASRSVLCDLLRIKDLVPSEDMLLKQVKEHKKKEARNLFNKHANYFKHANRDPDELIDFDDEINGLAIMLGIRDYDMLAGKSSKLMSAFTSWFYVRSPDLFNLPEELTKSINFMELQEIASEIDKKFFIDNYPKLFKD